MSSIRGLEARAAYQRNTPPAPNNPTSQAIQREPGVRGSVGSTGPARGIQSNPEISRVPKWNPGDATKLDIGSNTLQFTGAYLAGGEKVSIRVDVPEVSTPLRRLKESGPSA